MKILHVVIGKRLAGAERLTLDLLGALRARGFDAALVLLEIPRDSGASIVAEAQRRAIPCERVVLDGRVSPRASFELQGLFRRARPDVVHTHLDHADLHAIPAARFARVPRIVTTHHNVAPARRVLARRLVSSALWRRVDRIIAVSESVKAYAIATERIAADRIEVVYPGLPPAPVIDREWARARLRTELGIASEAVIVGAAGRLVVAKGFDDLLRAFRTIAVRFPGAHLAIAGEGPMRAPWERLAGERVFFVGWKEEVHPFLAALDLFAAPSVSEGFGMSIVEAMQRELPVVATNAGGIPEIVVDGETGSIVRPREVPALEAAIEGFLADEGRRRSAGRAGAARARERFSLSRMVEDTLAVYDRIDARRSSSR